MIYIIADEFLLFCFCTSRCKIISQ